MQCFSLGSFKAGRRSWSAFNFPDNGGLRKEGSALLRRSSCSCLTELNGKHTMLTNIAALLLKVFSRKCFADVKRAFIN